MNKRHCLIPLFALLTGCALDSKMCKPGERDIHVKNYWTYGSYLLVTVGDTSTNLPFDGILIFTQKMGTNKIVPAIAVTVSKGSMVTTTNLPATKLDSYFQSRQIVLRVREDGDHLFFE